jgi:alpha-ketoglutarate-dependent taurine dioxygenase
MVGIEGFDKPESDAIMNHLFNVYERATDIQMRWTWTPGCSAIWDNRCTIHTVSFDYEGQRHGTRVSSLAEKPFFDPNSKSRAQALNLPGWLNTKDFIRDELK